MRQNYNRLLQDSCFGNDESETGEVFENLSMIDANSTGANNTPSMSNTYTAKPSHHGSLKHQNPTSSSFNTRSKGILRYKKPLRKMRSSNFGCSNENEKQRTGLNSILRSDDDI